MTNPSSPVKLPIRSKIMAIIYRGANQQREYLALRNNPADPVHGGDFWFVVTGKVEGSESLIEAVKREIWEETSLEDIITINDLNKIYTYTCEGEKGHLCQEHAFSVQVAENKPVRLSIEHIEFLWLPKKEFIQKVQWNDKEDLIKLLEKIND